MKMRAFYLICTVVCLLCLSTAQGAITFDLLYEDSRSGVLNSTYAYQYNYSVDGVGLEVSGWKDDDGITQQYVGQWNGLGDEIAIVPDHAIDNHNGYDMLLLSFDQSVSLDSVSHGYAWGDTDMSIMALTGGSFSDFTGESWADLLSEGWESAGNYSEVPVGTPITIVPDLMAQYWLVGAYNPTLGGSDYLPDGKPIGIVALDYFKLKTVTICPTPAVPVPGSILLACTGLALVRYFRRRQYY